MNIRRALLHRTRLEAFKEWCAANGVETRAGKGDFQVLQVRVGKGWVPVYDRHLGDHYTTEASLMPTIRRFIGGAA